MSFTGPLLIGQGRVWVQCSGMTSRGERCRLVSAEPEYRSAEPWYCHHHASHKACLREEDA